MDHSIRKKLVSFLGILLLAYFTFSAWHYITLGTIHFNTDYKTFYHSLYESNNVYQINKYAIVGASPNMPYSTAINFNSPTMSFVLKGLVNITKNLEESVFIWTLLCVLGILTSVAILIRCLISTQIRLDHLLWITLLSCFSWTSSYGFSTGQVAFIVLPVLALCFYWTERKKWLYAAIAMGFLASIKLFFLAFALYFLEKNKRLFLLIFCLSFLGFFFLPLIYFPWSIYIDFYKLMQQHILFFQRASFSLNGSLFGVLCKLVVIYDLPLNTAVLRIIFYFISLFSLILWLAYDYVHLRTISDSRVVSLRFCFILIIALLFSPLSWFYYYIFLLIPAFVFYSMGDEYQFSRWFFIFLFLSQVFPFITPFSSGILKYLTPYTVFLSLICWLICLILVVHAVEHKEKPQYPQKKMMLGIFIASSCVTLVLLLMNIGYPHFLDGKYEQYLKKMPVKMWVE